MASVAKHIRRLRTEQHMTQEDLAEKLFVTRQTVSAWETGKAQPDLETLERIAVVLDVEVTELIYGTPQSPNLRELKQKWAVIGGALVSAIAVMLFSLGYFDYLGTWSGGFSYQYDDLDYTLSFSELPGTYSVDIDLEHPESNIGKVLYEDESGCRIIVDEVFQADGPHSWVISFLSEGTCRQSGSKLVTPAVERPAGKRSGLFSSDFAAALTTTADGVSWPGKFRGMAGLQKKGNQTDYYLFHAVFNSNNGTSSGFPRTIQNQTVTVTLEGLTCFATIRE